MVLAVAGLAAAVGAYKIRVASPSSQSLLTWLIARRFGIDLNQYRLRLSEGQSPDHVDVWWWHADEERERLPTRVVSSGVSTGATPLEYGPNTFLLCYKGTLLGRFSHWKTNRNHFHTYFIAIQRKPGGDATANVTAEGPDEVGFEPYPGGAQVSLSDRAAWSAQAAQCRAAVEPRVAADRAAPGR